MKSSLVGQTVGRLSILSIAAPDKHGYTRYNCRCSCGVEKIIPHNRIQKGDAKSCGCLRREAHQQFGQRIFRR